MVLYTNKIQHAYKMKMLPIIKMNPKFKNDKGLHKHEYQHVIQYLVFGLLVGVPLTIIFNWFIGLIVGVMAHDIVYTFSTKYRLWSEVSAFKAQLKVGGSIDLAAKALSENYGLHISVAEAKRLLK
ncbi:hypothetical protein HOV44_gp131 [Rheinheimera phage Barba5S]|uniref:Uncharacterized protein n=4 Tax=Barbavirus TaxID=2733095 RepID=A0A4P8N5J9_9CAUD|nr:hypothetical protein HOV44_gp131 [Rheinheimera phage Barba5S]YP_009822863.1 hypothetical protein HOV45_gp127 [Rheinheimera phage Barba8S]QCQ61138.1 hypothetical protein Barba15A_gp129 [Rheinheimera phage vB_RspM_Barba15A]QCQ63623.1 hypothetical protein Barba26A_gp126 [Rheinheimera phage vB_RspM_Barba26A]QCQ59209.1 hypothetical protein Barba5S_gp131 [Rheinheimera phage Barba5S]QCQ59758.1 hypothetical protein Barba8S_gp127 [Rheinheimera phage Barba8S]